MKLLLSLLLLVVATAAPIRRLPVTRRASEVATLCGQYSGWSGDGYNANNNLWGESYATSGSQCTYVDSSSSSGVGWHTTWTWDGMSNKVKSYAYAGRVVERGHTISSISSMQTSVSWSYNETADVKTNVAYDFFTDEDPNHSTSGGQYELMIWLARFNGATPLGSMMDTVDIAGHSWDLYIGTNMGMQVYSFAATSNIGSFNADVKDFFDYLADNQGYPANAQNLLVFQLGSEASAGGPATFKVDLFSAEVKT